MYRNNVLPHSILTSLPCKHITRNKLYMLYVCTRYGLCKNTNSAQPAAMTSISKHAIDAGDIG